MFDPVVLAEIISDSIGMDLPQAVQRQVRLPDVPNMANVILGMRRSGKTWLFYQEMQRLLKSGVQRSQLLYFNLEDERLLGMNVSEMKHILDNYYRLFPENLTLRTYIFFDEIQCIQGWETYIRRILDSDNVKIYITGSSSKMLSQDLATNMRGRCIESTIYPFSYREFLESRGIDVPTNLDRISKSVRSRLEHETLQYLELGGFPALTHLESIDRTQVLQSYVDTVIFRDCIERHGLTNVLVLKYLIKRLLSNVGERFSINRFFNDLQSQGIKCGKSTIMEYLDHLQQAFLVFPVSIESESEKKKQVNPKKFYSIDTGIAKAYSSKKTADLEHLLENVIFIELQRRKYQVCYLTATSGLEINFSASLGSHHQLIQVSADIYQESTLQRELAPFSECNGEDVDRLLITLNEERTILHEKGDIHVIPAWKWLLGWSSL